MKLFEKLFCMHDYEVIKEVKYSDRIVLILKCRKCGKLKRMSTLGILHGLFHF